MSTLEPEHLFRITWPIFIEQLLFILMGTADTLMISHVSGAAVAAVGTCTQIVGMVLLIFNMISSGSAVLLSQYLGAKRNEDCAKIAALSITINLLIGLFMSFLLYFFRDEVSVIMHLPANVSPYVDTYFRLVGATIFMQSLLGITSSILRANGFTRVTMFVSLGMNIIHIVGNYLFIFGVFGIPKLGVLGVSISTSMSRTLAFFVMFILLVRYVPFRMKVRDFFHPHWDTIKRILAVGIPSGGEPMAYQISQIVMVSFMASLGATVLATRVYVMSIMSYVIVFGMSLGFGTSILVGHLVGARQVEKAYHLVWRSLFIALSLTFSTVGLIALFGHSLLSVFTKNPFILHLGSTLMIISIILEMGRTFNLVIIQSMRAAGDVKFPVMMGMIFPFLLGIPLCYVLGVSLHLGLIGMWLTILADECSRAIIMVFRWRSRVWQNKAVIDGKQSITINEN